MQSETLAAQVARICDDLKGRDIAILRVDSLCSFTDYLVMVSAMSTTHARAMSQTLLDRAREAGRRPLGVEGVEGYSNWILVDFGDVVVHLFLEETRRYYNLERLWGDAPCIEWQESHEDANPTASG